MDRPDAERLALMLLTAFPYPKARERDVELWIEYLTRLKQPALAHQVVDGLIANHLEQRRPTVAQVMQSYSELLQAEADRRAAQRGLPDADVSLNRDQALEVLRRLDEVADPGPFTHRLRADLRQLAGLPAIEEADPWPTDHSTRKETR
jgi:hypothetical protein